MTYFRCLISTTLTAFNLAFDVFQNSDKGRRVRRWFECSSKTNFWRVRTGPHRLVRSAVIINMTYNFTELKHLEYISIDLLGFDVCFPYSNHTRIQMICHVDKFTLWHKEKTLEELRVGQFEYDAEEVYWFHYRCLMLTSSICDLVC